MTTMTCIECPRGCRMTVDHEAAELRVKGHACRRGEDYARREIENPRRVITTTVATAFSDFPRLPVKTSTPVPMGRIFECMEAINVLRLERRLGVGDRVATGILDGLCDLIATDDMGPDRG